MKSLNMVGSMGRTGVCWDNALAESFFASLRKELVHRTVYTTRKKAALRISAGCAARPGAQPVGA